MAKTSPAKQKRPVSIKTIAIVAVAVAFLATVLWWFAVYKNSPKDLGAKSRIPHAQSSLKAPPGGGENQSTPNIEKGSSKDSNIKTLDIPELNAQMVLPDGLEGVEYSVSPMSTTDTQVVLLTTKGLLKYQSCASARIGSITRSITDPHATLPKGSYDWKYLGGYYFFLQLPQQPCSTDIEGVNLQTEQMLLLKEGFKSLKSE